MKEQDYERVGDILNYINSADKIIEPLEIIAMFIPSMYDLNLVYNKVLEGAYHDIRIDSRDRKLKGIIRKAHELKHEQEFTSEMIYKYLKES